MSIIQHGWQKSEFVAPKQWEIVWIVDDLKRVVMAIYEPDAFTRIWRVFGSTECLYGHRWWQKSGGGLGPRPEPPRPEAAQEGVYGPGDPPDVAPSLTPTPTKQRYHMTTTKGPTDCCPGCWECDPSRFDPPAGCQGDPDLAAGLAAAVDKMIMDDVRYALVGNSDRVNAPEPLGEPANIRTMLAQLSQNILILVELVRTLFKSVAALDSHQKQVDARFDEIEKHTDFSHNSK